ALRIRQVGQRRIQTIKLPVDAPTGLQTFREIESDVAGDIPDLTRIPEEEMKTHLGDPGVAAALAPVFTTEFRRTVWPVTLQESEIEVAFEVGALRAAAPRTPVWEM